MPALASPALEELGDAGSVPIDGAELVMTTDSFVVTPIRFPGGSIGELAVNGTVNDLAVAGAHPVALTLSMILEEGLGADELRAEVEAIARARAGRRPGGGRRHQGGRARPCRLDVHLHDGRRSARPPCPPVARRAASPAIACSSPDRSASTGRRSCWPATSSSWTRRSSPTRARCGPRSTRCWAPRGPSCTACATPPGAESPRS